MQVLNSPRKPLTWNMPATTGRKQHVVSMLAMRNRERMGYPCRPGNQGF